MKQPRLVGLKTSLSLILINFLVIISVIALFRNQEFEHKTFTTELPNDHMTLMPNHAICVATPESEQDQKNCLVLALTLDTNSLPTPVSFFKNDVVPPNRPQTHSARLTVTPTQIAQPPIEPLGEKTAGAALFTQNRQQAKQPARSSLVSPAGIVKSVQPAYQWDAVSGAEEYQLLIKNADNQTLHELWLAAADNCGKTQCENTPNLTLSAGSYTWQILARNAAGEGEWSEAMSFTVSAPPPPPGTATPVSPSGSLSPGRTLLIFAWSGVFEASAYGLTIKKVDGTPIFDQWVGAEEVCSGINCQVTPALALAPGEYQWLVQTRNAGGNGPASNPLSFSISP